MARDRDNPLGVEFRGNERSMHFVQPYRHIGELNQVERWKLDRHPLEVADAVISRYAKEGPGAIATVPGEQERLKWVGLYPQRQGGDAFMMRVKVPGGVLTADQAREIGVVADAFGEGPEDSAVFGNRYADITTRQDIQIHWIRIGDVPRIWERFADVGLTTVQACGDSARNVLCCPVSGVDADEVFDALPVALDISEFFTGNREYANLPRKFKMSVTRLPARTAPRPRSTTSGCGRPGPPTGPSGSTCWPAAASPTASAWPRTSTCSCGPTRRSSSPGPSPSCSASSATARTGAWPACATSCRSSDRSSSAPSCAPGPASPSCPAGEELTTRYRGDHVGVHPQREDGLVYVGCSVPVGRMSGIELVEAARLAATYGDGTVRLGTDQNFVLTRGAPRSGSTRCSTRSCCRSTRRSRAPSSGAWWPAPAASSAASPWWRRRSAPSRGRAGSTPSWPKAGTARAPRIRQRHVGAHPTPASSACTSRAARRRAPNPRSPTSGFRGDTAHVGEHIVEAVDIGMGGSLGPDAAFIDWIESARPVDDVPEALLRTVRRYQAERRDGEPFYNWARRMPNEELARHPGRARHRRHAHGRSSRAT